LTRIAIQASINTKKNKMNLDQLLNGKNGQSDHPRPE